MSHFLPLYLLPIHGTHSQVTQTHPFSVEATGLLWALFAGLRKAHGFFSQSVVNPRCKHPAFITFSLSSYWVAENFCRCIPLQKVGDCAAKEIYRVRVAQIAMRRQAKGSIPCSPGTPLEISHCGNWSGPRRLRYTYVTALCGSM